MEQTEIRIAGEMESKNVAGILVGMSTPFAMEPLPDDEYGFAIKSEVLRTVARTLDIQHIPYVICG